MYEVSTIMVPQHIREGLNFIEALDLVGNPMCTGILAYDPEGQVNHARNLDFGFPKHLEKLLYNAKFTKAGVEVFRAQMVWGYSGVLTGFKKGGFSVEINTRFSQVRGQNKDTLENLILKRRNLAAWMVRETLENQ
jgi:hypothetical protein